MVRLDCTIVGHSKAPAPGLHDEDTLRKQLGDKLFDELHDDGMILIIPEPASIASGTSATVTETPIDVLLEADRSEMSSADLKRIAKHYDLKRSGSKDTIRGRIAAFEALLDSDLSEATDDDILGVAEYLGVDVDGLSHDEIIAAIDAASE